MDVSLLTESSDEDAGAVGGVALDNCGAEDLNIMNLNLDALSVGSSTSEESRHGGFGEGEEDELPTTGENLIEYSEVLVPATKSYPASVEESQVLLNLLEDVPSTSANDTSRSSVKSKRHEIMRENI